MRRKSLIVLFCLLAFSILKGCSQQACGCVHFDTDVIIKFVDQDGRNLVNPDHPQAMTQRNTDLFVLEEDGEKQVAGDLFDVLVDSTRSRY